MSRHLHPDHDRDIVPLHVRRYLYAIATAVVPILVAYGIIDEQIAPLWLALALQVTATGTAIAYTPQDPSA